MGRPEKIFVVGFSGAGKTTLAERIGKELRLPVVHIDERCFNSEHRRKPIDEVVEIISDIVSADKWVIDGMYQKIAEQFISKADLLIFIDVDFFTNTKNVVIRKVKQIISPRHELPEGSKKRIQMTNIKRIWVNRKAFRKEWIEIINRNKNSFNLIKISKVNKKKSIQTIKKIREISLD